MGNVIIILGVIVLLFVLMRWGGMGCCGAGHSQTPSGEGKKNEKEKSSLAGGK
jgi:hypothetical protein